MSLGIQQTYSCTLCTHINNIYNRLSAIEKQVQHHCMYPHQTDTVQINAPEYVPDIDRDDLSSTHNSPPSITPQGTPEIPQEPSVPEDDNSAAPDNIDTSQNQQETDWPDDPTVQIPGVSSMTLDHPPEVIYHRHQTQDSPIDFEIPELEGASDVDQFEDLDTLIMHHNNHQENQQIRQEYSAKLQSLSDEEYFAQIDDTVQLQYHTPVSSYDWPTRSQAPQQSTEELKRLYGKGRGKAR